MKKHLLTLTTGIFLATTSVHSLHAHCQMPCGIYHDDMVYDQIDQYAETMYKCCSELNSDHATDSIKDRQQFVRWIMEKEKASDEVSILITTYFLQQKIKPGEEDTTKRLILAHNLLFLIVQIKQNCDVKFTHEFMETWEQFKHMFHRKDYECKIEQSKLQQWKKEAEALKAKEAAEKEAAEKSEKPLAEAQKQTHNHADPHTHDHTH